MFRGKKKRTQAASEEEIQKLQTELAAAREKVADLENQLRIARQPSGGGKGSTIPHPTTRPLQE